ncbi:uncharacterized protein LOC111135873 isoform X4 [Crassostrea virginica]
MQLYRALCLIFLGTFLPFHECRELKGYKFPVYTTETCPRNETEWNERSAVFFCRGESSYACLPNENITELLEFCYPLEVISIHQDPSCVSIGNGCFLAEPSCESATQQTKQERPQQSNKSELIWIPSLLGVLVLCTILFISIVIYRRKRSNNIQQPKIKSDEENPETHQLLSQTDKENDHDAPITPNQKKNLALQKVRGYPPSLFANPTQVYSSCKVSFYTAILFYPTQMINIWGFKSERRP